MFAADAKDLADGKATIRQIISRNIRADLADPWPTLHDLERREGPSLSR
jgi:hypothetical protein